MTVDAAAASRGAERVILLGDGLWAAAALRHLGPDRLLRPVFARRRPTDGSFERAALELGCPVERPARVNGPAFVARLAALRPDLVLCVSHDQLFRRAFLEGVGAPVVNVHAGDPARVRGRAALTWQLLEGRARIELCAVLVDERIDAGPVLARRAVDLPEDAEYGEALRAVSARVPALLDALPAPAALRSWPRGDSPESGEAVYYPRRLEGDEWIDWTGDPFAALRLVRALAPPNCQAAAELDGRRVSVRRAAAAALPPSAGAPGAVIGRREDGALLARCGDGALWIETLLEEDGRPVDGARVPLSARFRGREDWLRGRLERRVAELERRLERAERLQEASA